MSAMVWSQLARRALGGTAATLLAVTALAGCTSPPPPVETETPTPTATGTPVELRIITKTEPDPVGMEALLIATLEADSNGCVYAGAGDDRVALVWPQGYTVSGTLESFTVHDANGDAVATSGVDVNIGGGGGGPMSDEWTNTDCTADAIWMVGQIGK